MHLQDADVNIKTDQRDFVDNILFDVYSDFEKTLEHATTHSRKNLDRSKFCIYVRVETSHKIITKLQAHDSGRNLTKSSGSNRYFF